MVLRLLLFVVLFPATGQTAAQEPEPAAGGPPQPPSQTESAQQPARPANIPTEAPCQIKRDGTAILQAGVAGAVSPNPSSPMLSPSLEPSPCPPLAPLINWYARFLNGPQVKPLTAKEKGLLAIRNLGNPFNFLTIAGISAIAVASNSHSPYGPGFPGFARNAGVSFTEDMTSEFFGTFAIPTLVHQDPHYHRMPKAPVKRRILHAITQVVWTQGDNGKGMINYADLAGFAIDGGIANLYVPGQQTNVRATAARYGIGLGTAPIDNFITEFLPTISNHIRTRVVFVQNIINQVARTETAQ